MIAHPQARPIAPRIARDRTGIAPGSRADRTGDRTTDRTADRTAHTSLALCNCSNNIHTERLPQSGAEPVQWYSLESVLGHVRMARVDGIELCFDRNAGDWKDLVDKHCAEASA